ncbi:MAG: YfjI family protein [Acidobacteria bacterium]|nr:YfjI family protein [Acidobacteriota bacterium]
MSTLAKLTARGYDGPPAEVVRAALHLPTATGWPKRLPLGDELPAVEQLQLEMLPEAFRPLVADVAERMQVCPDFVAAPLLCGLAGATGRRALIQPKVLDTSWTEYGNVWGGIVGTPGAMKTPTIQAALAALKGVQARWIDEDLEAMANYRRDEEAFELRVNGWRQQATQAGKRGTPAPARPDSGPVPPPARRLIVNDATAPAIHQVLIANPAGVLIFRDELSGWLSAMEQEGRADERGFFLEAWSGHGAFTMERIGRGSLHAKALCVSVFGGIQPDRLRGYLAESMEGGPKNDGLMQRFQVFVWPDPPARWRNVDRLPNHSAIERITAIFETITAIDPDHPLRFKFSQDGQKLFNTWHAELEHRLRAGTQNPIVESHLAKYRGLMPKLAMLFYLADDPTGGDGLIGLAHARQAATWCEYLESHARRVYSSVISPELRAARTLAERIAGGEIGADGVLRVRDIYRRGWSGLANRRAAIAALEVLSDHHYVRPVLPLLDSAAIGRPSEEFEINPKAQRGR